jgi:hypothetical protein
MDEEVLKSLKISWMISRSRDISIKKSRNTRLENWPRIVEKFSGSRLDCKLYSSACKFLVNSNCQPHSDHDFFGVERKKIQKTQKFMEIVDIKTSQNNWSRKFVKIILRMRFLTFETWRQHTIIGFRACLCSRWGNLGLKY